MGRGTVFTIAVIMFSLGVAAGVLGITWSVGGSGEPSEPISSETLSLDPTADPAQMAAQIAAMDEKLDTALAQLETRADAGAVSTLSAQIAGLSAAMAAGEAPVVIELTPTVEAPEPTAVPTEVAAVADSPGGRSLFRIDNERSVVRFEIFEELGGLPNDVIGATDQVAGDIIVDYGVPANSQVGEIRINARTFATDSEFRNRALRSEILESARDEYEFISFEPTQINNLPETLAVGDEISFQVVGNLKIRDITNVVTFEVTATLVSEERINGLATTMVTREAYNLTIPSVPNVANVADEVFLELEFVARLVDES